MSACNAAGRTLGAILLASAALFALGCDRNGTQAPEASSSGAAASDVAAVFNGEEIRLAQVDERALKNDLETFQALYDARRSALDSMIDERLLEEAAASRGVSVEALVANEIDAKTQLPSEADVETFYEQNKQSMRGQTLDQIGPRIQVFLSERARGERRAEFLGGLHEQAKIQVLLDPPRADVVVGADEPALGPVTAAVTIVEYSDFQ